MEENTEGSDWLHSVISHIIATHNGTIENFSFSAENLPMIQFLRSNPSEIQSTEISFNTAVVGNLK